MGLLSVCVQYVLLWFRCVAAPHQWQHGHGWGGSGQNSSIDKLLSVRPRSGRACTRRAEGRSRPSPPPPPPTGAPGLSMAAAGVSGRATGSTGRCSEGRPSPLGAVGLGGRGCTVALARWSSPRSGRCTSQLCWTVCGSSLSWASVCKHDCTQGSEPGRSLWPMPRWCSHGRSCACRAAGWDPRTRAGRWGRWAPPQNSSSTSQPCQRPSWCRQAYTKSSPTSSRPLGLCLSNGNPTLSWNELWEKDKRTWCCPERSISMCQPLWQNKMSLPDRWWVLLINAAWRQIPEKWQRGGFRQRWQHCAAFSTWKRRLTLFWLRETVLSFPLNQTQTHWACLHSFCVSVYRRKGSKKPVCYK